MYSHFTPEEEAILLRAARESIGARLNNLASPLPKGLTGRLLEPGSAFVTLHLHHRLRGCIGDLEARLPLIESVCRNAEHAAFADPRFPPVTLEEFPNLQIEVTCLSPAREVASVRDIVLGMHGIVLRKDDRRAVFLPQVATDQGWDLETTLEHLAVKAGLPRDAWRHDATFKVFDAVLIRDPE